MVCCTRYVLRVQGMQLRLEFAEKKEDLEPALKTFHEAVDGGYIVKVIGDVNNTSFSRNFII